MLKLYILFIFRPLEETNKNLLSSLTVLNILLSWTCIQEDSELNSTQICICFISFCLHLLPCRLLRADCIQSLLMNCSGFSSKVCVPGLLSELRVRQQGIKLNPIHLLPRKARCINLLWLKCKQSNVNSKKLNWNVTNYEIAFRVYSNIKVSSELTES